ncbi:ACP phosphodiesterase [Reinekea thalattae]|nr:acyl carrier protein phosphodiesterase [Reinekea thalattae]
MNYLGHCLLSVQTPSALMGSLWPDFAKRPEAEQCSTLFLQHFDRHQLIDQLTDTSPTLTPVRDYLRPTFRKTTPVVIDMLLDHHIALHWQSYSSLTLEQFAHNSYQQLSEFNEMALPIRLTQTIETMRNYNWFIAYRSPQGIEKALQGVAKRIRFTNPLTEQAATAVASTQRFKRQFDQHIDELCKHLELSL